MQNNAMKSMQRFLTVAVSPVISAVATPAASRLPPQNLEGCAGTPDSAAPHPPGQSPFPQCLTASQSHRELLGLQAMHDCEGSNDNSSGKPSSQPRSREESREPLSSGDSDRHGRWRSVESGERGGQGQEQQPMATCKSIPSTGGAGYVNDPSSGGVDVESCSKGASAQSSRVPPSNDAAKMTAASFRAEQGVDITGNQVTLAGGRESPYNAAWEAAKVTAGRRCFRFTIESGSCPFIGVCPVSLMDAEGYKMRMLGFGACGNLINSCGAKICNWAKPPTSRLELMVEVAAGGKVKMWYQLDGQPHGLAFDVTDAVFNEGAVPVLHGQNCCIVCEELAPDSIPETRAANLVPEKFKLTEASASQLNGGPPPRLTLSGGRLSIRVLNTMGGAVGPDGVLSGGISTRMLARGPAAETEKLILDFFDHGEMVQPDVNHVSLQKGDKSLDFEADFEAGIVMQY